MVFDLDDLFNEAVKIVVQYNLVSSSLLQRRLSIGYARAARIMDQLERHGIISQSDGSSSPRKVLIESFDEYKALNIQPTNLSDDENYKKKDYDPIIADYLPAGLINISDPLKLPLGTMNGKVKFADLSKIGNLLITGNGISKKFEFVESYLTYIISNFKTDQINTIVADTSAYLKIFDTMPHLLSPVITEPDKLISAGRWAVAEYQRRIKTLATDRTAKFPQIVFIVNPYFFGIETADSIKFLSSIGSRAGIHLMLMFDSATEVPKIIRVNFPYELKFEDFGKNEATFGKNKEILTTFEFKNKKVRDYLDKVKFILNTSIN